MLYLPSKWNDLKVFHISLMTWLEEADGSQEEEVPLKVDCLSSIAAPDERQLMKSFGRRRQLAVIRRFKQWKILSDVFCHDLGMNGRAFSAIAVITQLPIQMTSLCFRWNMMIRHETLK